MIVSYSRSDQPICDVVSFRQLEVRAMFFDKKHKMNRD